MGNKRGRKGASAGAWRVCKCFWSFTRCLRRGFLRLFGVSVNEGHGVVFL